ncbi:hypothetical protein H8959_019650, partial [Pygathrix nigripes]
MSLVSQWDSAYLLLVTPSSPSLSKLRDLKLECDDLISVETFSPSFQRKAFLKVENSESLRHLIPECKMEQTPESLPQNNNPDSNRTSEVYLHEELQEDMQKFKNEVNTLEEEFLALKKETVQLQKEVEEEMEKHRSNRTELTGTLTDGATVGSDDDGLNQQIPRKENGEHDSYTELLALPFLSLLRKHSRNTSDWAVPFVWDAFSSASLLAFSLHSFSSLLQSPFLRKDFSGHPRIPTTPPLKPSLVECLPHCRHSVHICSMCEGENVKNAQFFIPKKYSYSVSLPIIQDTFCLCECLLKLKNNCCDRLRVKLKHLENTVSVLQNELFEAKKAALQLELQKIELEKELVTSNRNLTVNGIFLSSLPLKYIRPLEEIEVVQEQNNAEKQLSKEQNARILQDQILTRKEKELEMAQKKINSDISHRHQKEKDILHENCMLQEEIAWLRLEIDTIKNQNKQKENQYLEDIEVVKEKNDNLQKIIKLNEETLTETIL